MSLIFLHFPFHCIKWDTNLHNISHSTKSHSNPPKSFICSHLQKKKVLFSSDSYLILFVKQIKMLNGQKITFLLWFLFVCWIGFVFNVASTTLACSLKGIFTQKAQKKKTSCELLKRLSGR